VKRSPSYELKKKKKQLSTLKAPDCKESDLSSIQKMGSTSLQRTLSTILPVCSMKNLGSTCWFNSMMQTLSASSFSRQLVEHWLALPDFEEVSTTPLLCVENFMTVNIYGIVANVICLIYKQNRS